MLEYFVSTHGTRKGMADTALRTADSGYLTRRLVDVAQDVIVHEIDCGTNVGVPYPLHNEKGELDENLIGRCLLEDVKGTDGSVVMEGDNYITSIDQLVAMEAAGVEEVTIRTVMTCHAEHGVCQKCYGWDLATGASGQHRHRRRHHRRPVHRRAGHAADHAYVPHRRRRRRGHHARPAARPGAVRGPQA